MDKHNKENDKLMIITADLCNIKDIERFALSIKEKYGRLDILINNIERGGWPKVHGEYVEDQWDLEIETTLKACLLLIKDGPYMTGSV